MQRGLNIETLIIFVDSKSIVFQDRGKEWLD